jgi:alkylation response protein AidB-like acyl-CoA dehydrogenase
LDFAWSEEQHAFRQSVTEFARKELGSDLIEEDRRQEFSQEEWKECARFGIQGLPVPEEWGGGNADILTIVAALEALGHGCRNNGLIFSLNAHMWGCELPIVAFGAEAQKRKYLPRLASGEWIGAQAITGSGGSATRQSVTLDQALQTNAERRDGRWVLNGSKTLVTNGPVADVVIVFARVEPAGTTAFIVEKGGFTATKPLETMGLRTLPRADLTLTYCELSDDQVLGEIGAGAEILEASTDWASICALAGEVGMIHRQLEVSSRYAAERRQFGQPIGKFPAVASKVADMDIRLEISRLLLYKAAWLKREGSRAQREIAIAKAYVGDAAIQTCRDAVQIHGGYGYMTEYQIERELRDAVSAKIQSGTTEAQKAVIAGLRGL